MEFELTPQLIAWGKAHGYGERELQAHRDYFVDYLANKSGKPYKDLNAAFRNCVRSDWGNIRRQMVKAPIAPVKQWWETASGIEAKGAEFGLQLADFAHFQAFRAAVMSEALVRGVRIS